MACLVVLQSLLSRIERQIADFQHQQRLADLELELAHINRQPVDIQIGDQVYEDMPQEMRSRLWYVLLERPDLAAPLRVSKPSELGTEDMLKAY